MGNFANRVAGLALIGIVAATGLAGCSIGNDDSDAASELSEQKKLDEARAQGQRDQQLKELQKKLERMEKKGGNTTTAPPSGGGGSRSPSPATSATSGPTNCGDGLTAGSNTSCPFARAVRDAYPGSANTFEVYSSVTGQTYGMACTTSSPHVCRGGNNAAVYFP